MNTYSRQNTSSSVHAATTNPLDQMHSTHMPTILIVKMV